MSQLAIYTYDMPAYLAMMTPAKPLIVASYAGDSLVVPKPVAGVRPLISVPLASKPDVAKPYTLRDVAADKRRDAFKVFGSKLTGPTIVRPGWEHNGRWMPWSSIPDPALYAEAFRRCVDAIRAACTVPLTVEWNLAEGTSWSQLSYPGDAYCSYAGVDTYDRPDLHRTPAQRNAWLSPWEAWALDRGRFLACSEWGVWNVDAPAYMAEMVARFKAKGYHYQTYFDVNGQDGIRHDLRAFPQSQAVYVKAYAR